MHGLRETIAVSAAGGRRCAPSTMRWVPLGVIRRPARGSCDRAPGSSGDPAATALPVATAMLGVLAVPGCSRTLRRSRHHRAEPRCRSGRRRAVKVAVRRGRCFAASLVRPPPGSGRSIGPTWAMTAMAVGVGARRLVARRIGRDEGGCPDALGAGGSGRVGRRDRWRCRHDRESRSAGLPPSTLDRVPVGDPRSYWTSVIALALVVSLAANRDPALRGFRLSRRRASSTPVRPLAAGEPR